MKLKTILIILATITIILIGSIPHVDYMWFVNATKWYPGDIWYVYDHYIVKGCDYPIEYPSLMRVFVQVMNTVTKSNYVKYLWTTIYFLLPFAVGTSLIIFNVLNKQKSPEKNIWKYWLLAPTFIIVSTINYDHFVVFSVILSFYLAQSGKRMIAAVILGIGTAFKVFPCFFFPLILAMEKDYKEMAKMVAAFAGVWLYLNLPYMICAPGGIKSWLFPYIWQATNNYAKGPQDGVIWWPFFKYLGKTSCSACLLFTLLGILFIAFKAHQRGDLKENIWQWGRGIALLFVFFDKVYSPQYNLYLLPFIALSKDLISIPVFYAMEIPNALEIMFLYWLKDHPIYQQILVVIKYSALVVLMVQYYRGVVLHKKIPQITSEPVAEPVAESGDISITPPFSSIRKDDENGNAIETERSFEKMEDSSRRNSAKDEDEWNKE